MKITTSFLLVFFSLFYSVSSFSQSDNKVSFPDIPGFYTLKCDFHQHTVFSDGEVWPTIRVREAINDGLDAISITDHIEFQPHQSDIPHLDRNRSFEIAQKAAKDKLIVINGCEVTRSMPLGHINAIFITDANKLIQDDPIDALKEAQKQDAFLFWNHPNWIAQKKDGIAELTEMHKKLIKDNLIHGVEIVNGGTYSKEAFSIALENNLTILGNSDIHGIIDAVYPKSEEKHRPLTLLFAEEKTPESIKKALQQRRTVVWFKNTLSGDSKLLLPLLNESLMVRDVKQLNSYNGKSTVQSVRIENVSSTNLILENKSPFSLYNQTNIFTIKAHETIDLQICTLQDLEIFYLDLKVLNAYISANENAKIELKIIQKIE